MTARAEAGRQRTTAMVRVDQDVYAELVKIQQEFYDEHRVRISMSAVIGRLLADRKPVQP